MIARMVQTILFVVVAAIVGTVLYWYIDIIHRGGVVMIPIVMCSIFAVAIAIERFVYFFGTGPDTDQFIVQLRSHVQSGHWQEIEALCQNTKGSVARVTHAGLSVRERQALEIERVMEEAAREELPLVERHHRWLATLAQTATLLGLLGTVTGMVNAFQVIQSKATLTNPVNPADLAGGIWEALITTVAGLEVAIPTILVYNYFVGRSVEVQSQIERVAGIVAHWRRS